jgi:cytochrome P450
MLSHLETHALRIGPNELHINDVSKFKLIYGQNSKYLKDPEFYLAFGAHDSVFATNDPTHHRVVRAKLNPYFSLWAIDNIQALIKDSVRELDARLAARGYDKRVNLYNLCRCLPPDVVTKYSCARSSAAISTSDDSFDAPLLQAFDATASTTWSRAYFPFKRLLQDSIPLRYAAAISSDVKHIQHFTSFARDAYDAYKGRDGAPSHPVIFDALADMPDKTVTDNAMAIIAGGSDTTGYTLAFACWNLLQHPDWITTLRTEIDPHFRASAPELPSLATLRSLPYLDALVKESLRLGMAASSRLPRTVPKDMSAPLVIDGQIVPAGTTVSMSVYTMHTSEDIWGSNAKDFDPYRWTLEKPSGLASQLVPFSIGKRNCIGQNLATAELLFGIAHLFYAYDTTLCPGQHDFKILDRFTALLESPFYVHMAPRKIDT